MSRADGGRADSVLLPPLPPTAALRLNPRPSARTVWQIKVSTLNNVFMQSAREIFASRPYRASLDRDDAVRATPLQRMSVP